MSLTRILIGAVVLLAASVPTFAQVQIQPKQIQIQPILQPRLGEAPLLTPDAVEKIKFTDEQKDKYAKIEAEYKDKVKAAQAKYQADIMGLRDREKFKEAQDKLQGDSKKAREDGLGKVEPILTAEQKTVFAQVKGQVPQPNISGVIRPQPGVGGAGINPVLPPAVQARLQLTDDQKKQIADIQKEVEAKIMKVLTDEQKKQLEQIKKPIARPIQPLPINPRQPQIQPVPPNALPPAAPAVKRD